MVEPSKAPSNLYTGPLNVTIAFMGCNVNGYTSEEIMSGQNNTMKADMEAALSQLSSEILSETFQERRQRRLLSHEHVTLAKGARRLGVALENATVDNVENVGKFKFLPLKLALRRSVGRFHTILV